MSRAEDVVKSTPTDNWRAKEKAIEKEQLEWQDAVRRRKEKMFKVIVLFDILLPFVWWSWGYCKGRIRCMHCVNWLACQT